MIRSDIWYDLIRSDTIRSDMIRSDLIRSDLLNDHTVQTDLRLFILNGHLDRLEMRVHGNIYASYGSIYLRDQNSET